MNYPKFFDEIPAIALRDELSDFLGTFEDGMATFSYVDAAKIAGHSCPTVLGAYMMIQRGLLALYNDEIPNRGEIKIEFKNVQTEGVTGVIANIATAITGATSDFGFGGLGGKYNRKDLMSFGSDINGLMKITRVDTDRSVVINYDTSRLQRPEEMGILMQKSLQGIATDEERAQFKKMWQMGVEKIFRGIDNFVKVEAV